MDHDDCDRCHQSVPADDLKRISEWWPDRWCSKCRDEYDGGEE